MIKMRKFFQKGRLTLTASVIFCMFVASWSDLYIRTAHAGHDHDVHDFAAAELLVVEVDDLADDGGSSKLQAPSVDQTADKFSVDKFSHGCFVFMLPPTGVGAATLPSRLKRVYIENHLTPRSPTRLDRPPRIVS